MMFEPTPELSSDLEWMLQSGQANREMLIEALIEEYYRPVYRLTSAYYQNSTQGREMAAKTLSALAARVYQYRSSQEVDDWVFSQVLAMLRSEGVILPTKQEQLPPAAQALAKALQTIGEKQRLALLLQTVLDWTPPKIARLLRLKPEGLLEGAYRSLFKALEKAGDWERFPAFQNEGLESALRTSLQTHWPAPSLTPEELDALREEIKAKSSRQNGQSVLFSRVKEAILIVVAILAVLGTVWGGNLLLPEPDPTEMVTTRAPTRMGRGRPSSILGTPRPSMPRPTPSPFPEGVFYRVQPGQSLEDLAGLLEVEAQELLDLNRMASPEELAVGQNLLIPGKITPSQGVSPTPVVPRVLPSPQATPGSSAELFQTMRRHWSNWNTLWVDAYVSSFGPEGYHGPPLVERIQFWASRNQFLILTGPSNALPEEVLLWKGARSYRANLTQSPWFEETNLSRRVARRLEGLTLLFDPMLTQTEQGPFTHLEIIGREIVAGRETWIVDQRNDDQQSGGRVWVDQQTGLILRRQIYSPSDAKVIALEIIVRKVAFDQDFGQSLFDVAFPWRGGYALDPSGVPAPLDDGPDPWFTPPENAQIGYTAPPPAFNPANSPLTFQFPQYYTESDPEALVDLFADQYFLGKVQFGNPWNVACKRSPDGMKVAYARSVASPLRWFSLNDLQTVHAPFPAVLSTHFAFSPDSRKLAVFNQYGTNGSVDLLDLESGSFEHLIKLQDAKSFVWSPDGRSLAFIGRVNEPKFNESVMVMDVPTGSVTYIRSIDYETGNSSANWPTLKWGVEFPVEMGGLENCSAPPETAIEQTVQERNQE